MDHVNWKSGDVRKFSWRGGEAMIYLHYSGLVEIWFKYQ